MQNNPNRRMIFAGSALAVALGAATTAASGTVPQGKKKATTSMDHDHMDHSHMNHAQHGGAEFELTRDETRVVGALAECQTAGELCLSQCIEVLASGDAGMADCARAVRAMLAICKSAKSLVECHSTFAGQQLALCRDACNACESECAKHKSHHEACRNCAEACETAMDAIDRLLG